MELHDVLAGRRMVRAFRPDPVDPSVLARCLDDSLRSPTAGNARGVAWLVLEGPGTGAYWAHTTTADWRGRARRWAGFEPVPVVALSLFCRDAYERRYEEADKQRWGPGPAEWPVPYWVGDAAFCVQALLLGALDAGLGACFLGNFRGSEPLLAQLGVPDEWRLFGAVLLGHPAADDPPSASLERPSPTRRERVHRGAWGRH